MCEFPDFLREIAKFPDFPILQSDMNLGQSLLDLYST